MQKTCKKGGGGFRDSESGSIRETPTLFFNVFCGFISY